MEGKAPGQSVRWERMEDEAFLFSMWLTDEKRADSAGEVPCAGRLPGPQRTPEACWLSRESRTHGSFGRRTGVF